MNQNKAVASPIAKHRGGVAGRGGGGVAVSLSSNVSDEALNESCGSFSVLSTTEDNTGNKNVNNVNNSMICHACEFDCAFADGEMLSCETCRAVHYCSRNCLDWDLWNNGHAKVCQPIASSASSASGVNNNTATRSTEKLEQSQSSLSQSSFSAIGDASFNMESDSSTTQPSIDANHLFDNNHSTSSLNAKDFGKPTAVPTATLVTAKSLVKAAPDEKTSSSAAQPIKQQQQQSNQKDKRRQLPKSAQAPSGQLGSFLDHQGPKDGQKAQSSTGFALPSRFRMSNEDDDEDDDDDANDDDNSDDLNDEESLALSYIQNASANDLALKSIQEESDETEGPVDEASWRRKSSSYVSSSGSSSGTMGTAILSVDGGGGGGAGVGDASLSGFDSPSQDWDEKRRQDDDDEAYMNSPMHRIGQESTSSLTGNIDAREHNALVHHLLVNDSGSCLSTASCNLSDLDCFDDLCDENDDLSIGGGGAELPALQEESSEVGTSEDFTLPPMSHSPLPLKQQKRNDAYVSPASSSSSVNSGGEPSTSPTEQTSFSSSGKFSYLKRFRDSYSAPLDSSPKRALFESKRTSVVKQHFGTATATTTTSEITETEDVTESGDADGSATVDSDLTRISSLRDFRNLYYAEQDDVDMLSHHSEGSADASSVQLLDQLVTEAAGRLLEASSAHAEPTPTPQSTAPQRTDSDPSLNWERVESSEAKEQSNTLPVSTIPHAATTIATATATNGESEKLRLARLRHESLKNSLNSALRVYEEVHGQDAAKDIFMQLTNSLQSCSAKESLDSETNLLESPRSEHNETSEVSLLFGDQDNTEISEVSTIDCMVNPSDSADTIGSAVRYFHYRNSLRTKKTVPSASVPTVVPEEAVAREEIQPNKSLLVDGPREEVPTTKQTVEETIANVELWDSVAEAAVVVEDAGRVVRYLQYRENLALRAASTAKPAVVSRTVETAPVVPCIDEPKDDDCASPVEEPMSVVNTVEYVSRQIYETLSSIVTEAQKVPMQRYAQYRASLAKYDTSSRTAPTLPVKNPLTQSSSTVESPMEKSNAERIIYGVNDSLRTRTNAPEFLDVWSELESDRADIETGKRTSKIQTLSTASSSNLSSPAAGAVRTKDTSKRDLYPLDEMQSDLESGGRTTTAVGPKPRSVRRNVDIESGNAEMAETAVQTKPRERANMSEMFRYGMLAFLLIALPLFIGLCIILSKAAR